jgi:tetratricopeptide (TPR) repeat protein
MAYQHLRLDIGEFNLDLHDTEVREAKNVVARRIVECYRYGIRVLKIIYGTPDNFEGSIAKAVHQLVRCHELVAVETLPSYVFSEAEPEAINPALRVYLRQNPNPQPMDDDTSFHPFMPKFEHDIAKKLRCRTPYMPMRQLYPLKWSARAIRCSQDELSEIAKTPPLARLEINPGFFTWEALCLAAEKDAEQRKANNRQVPQQQIAAPPEAPASDQVAIPPPDDFLQRTLRSLAEAKQFALESRYEDAEKRLLSIVGATDLPPDTVEHALLELGRVYTALNKPEAEGVLRKCADLTIRRVGRGRHLLPLLGALQEFYVASGDFDAFLKLGRDNADLGMDLKPEERLERILYWARIEFFAGRHDDSLSTLRSFSCTIGDTYINPALDAERYDLLGKNYSKQYELFLAEIAFKCALRCCESAPKNCEDMRPIILKDQGMVSRRAGRYPDALKAYSEAAALLGPRKKSHSGLYAAIIVSMGVVYRHLHNLTLAEKCYEEVVEICKEEKETETPEYATLLNNLAALRIDQEKYDEAEALLNQAENLIKLKSGSDGDSLVTLHMHRGRLYHGRGDLDLCQVAFEEAVQFAQANLGADSVRTATAKDGLADCLFGRAEPTRVAGLYSEALEVFERVEGPASLHSIETRKKLKAVREVIKRQVDGFAPTGSGLPRGERDKNLRLAERITSAIDTAAGVVQAGNVLREETTITFGDERLPLSEPPNLASGLRRPYSPATMGKQKVGRNQPCPCGSGKKYKKCCGGVI